MHKTELMAGELVGYRLHAVDGEAGAVRDLVVDIDSWVIRYLVVDAQAWAPGNEVLVVPRSLAAIDEVRRRLDVELTAEEVRSSPAIAAASPLTREFEENWHRFHGWEEYWLAEVDAEAVDEPPVPPAPPAQEPLPAEAEEAGAARSPNLVRLEELLLWPAEAQDGTLLTILDLLIDDADWSVDYLEVEIQNLPVRERCLIGRSFVEIADPPQDRLQISADSEALRQAPRRLHPGAGADHEVRTLE